MSQSSQVHPSKAKFKAIFSSALFVFLIVLAIPGCQDELMEKDLTKAELMAKGETSTYCPYSISSITNTGYDFTFVINENFKCYSYVNFVLLKFMDCGDQPIKMDLSMINNLVINGKDYLAKPGALEFTNTSDCCFGSNPGDWDGYILKIDFADVLYHPITIEITLNRQVSMGKLLVNAGDSKALAFCGGNCSGESYDFEGLCDEKGVIDIDGNVYDTIAIGEQTWIAENLKTTRYINGDLIGTTLPSTLDISDEVEPKYQWAFEGDESNVDTYGRLYTWHAITDDRNVCPDGWHVPSSDDWTTLITYLETNNYGYDGGGDDIAKSLASTSNWYTNDIYPGTIGFEQEKNNSSGFNGMPAGERRNGVFCWTHGKIGSIAGWWSSTADEAYPELGTWYNLVNKVDKLYQVQGPKIRGISVRCVKD
ncbi:MAG: FISUMP domain-containing protein [Bacteroidales bacterium]|nr:FISUMP domain-containing protein [Bacteroidales bacterium]